MRCVPISLRLVAASVELTARSSGLARCAALALVLALGGCAFDGKPLDTVTEAYGRPDPTPQDFPICYAGGCGIKKNVSLTPEEWEKVAMIFAGPPEDARAERERIARGLQAMEVAVGARTGLWRDKHGTFPGFGRPKQMDCIDETANSNTYLQIFEKAGFLHHYRRGHRVSTSLWIKRNIWPHTVASIVDRNGGPEYIIDMWYGPHGDLPYIMTRAEWEKGAPLRREF